MPQDTWASSRGPRPAFPARISWITSLALVLLLVASAFLAFSLRGSAEASQPGLPVATQGSVVGALPHRPPLAAGHLSPAVVAGPERRPALAPDPPTGGWISCSTYISCGSGGLAWEIDSSGMGVNGYGYPSSGSDYTIAQAQSDIAWELSTYGGMMSVISAHYGVPEINMVTETGPETSFGTDGVDDIMQDLSSAWCGGGAGSQSPDTWALDYANADYSSCSSDWIHFISFAAGTAYLLSQSERYGANFDPGVLGPSYNAGSLVYTTTYSCSGEYDAWFLVMCSGGGLTASYSWNIAVAYNAALGSGTTPLTVSYAIQDMTTGSAVVCGGTVNSGDQLKFTASVSGGATPYSYAWSFGDGTTGSGNPVSHTYIALGTVNPTLTVADSSNPQQTTTTGAGCDITITGTPVTFYTSPTTAGTIHVGSQSFTNGQSAIYPDGGAYALSVSAPPSYVFLGWTATGGISLGSDLTPSTTMLITSTAPATLTVTLATEVPLTFHSSPPNSANASIGGETYSDGENASLTVGAVYPLVAVPNDGFVFVEWTVVGAGISLGSTGASSTTLTVDSTTPTVLTEVVRWNAPRAPTDLEVVGSTSTSLSLAWTPPPGTVTGYDVGYEASDTPPEGSSLFQLQDVGPGFTTETLVGLTPGTEYWLAVAAVNSTGQGAWTAWVPGWTLTLPGPPLYLSVEAKDPTFVLLGWQPPGGGSSVDSYTLNCSAAFPGHPVLVPGIAPSTTLYNLSGLNPGGTYNCFLTSLAGPYVSQPSNLVSFTLPPSPGGRTSVGSSGATAGLSWLTSAPYLYLVLAALALALLSALLIGARRRRGPSSTTPSPDATDGAPALGEAPPPETSEDDGTAALESSSEPSELPAADVAQGAVAPELPPAAQPGPPPDPSETAPDPHSSLAPEGPGPQDPSPPPVESPPRPVGPPPLPRNPSG